MRERGFFETEAMSTRRKEVVKTITKVHFEHPFVFCFYVLRTMFFTGL
jgi:hypothetical protein